MRGNAAGRMLAVEVRMGMSQRAAHALWEEHYGALAGWALAVLGDSDTARWVADEAFLALFADGHRRGAPRERLYRAALSLLESAGRQVADPVPGCPDHGRVAGDPVEPWLGLSVAGLPAATRRCVLLAHAGFTNAEVARILHLSRASVARRLLDATANQPVIPAPRAERPTVSAS